MELKVFFFPIPNALTLMNIGLPFHIFEPRYRKMIQDAVESEIPVAVTPPSVDYRGRVFAAGVPEVIQRYPDGRMDIVLRGELKGKVDNLVEDGPYKVFTFHELHEDTRLTDNGRFKSECLLEVMRSWAAKQLIESAQLELFSKVIENEISMVSYATLFLIDNPRTRQAILEQQCLEKKMDIILREWGPKEIKLGQFLSPIKV